MDMPTVITFACVIGAALCGIAAVLYREHTEAIRRLKEEQRRNSAALRNLESQTAYTVVRQDDMGTQASRLYQEQIGMKFEAMDACKTMLREAARYQNSHLE
ncbi:MAG: hypothetical protein ACK5MN_10555 [Lachnospiraceae bacterium]